VAKLGAVAAPASIGGVIGDLIKVCTEGVGRTLDEAHA
jgi:hypothetical protein